LIPGPRHNGREKGEISRGRGEKSGRSRCLYLKPGAFWVQRGEGHGFEEALKWGL